jgi:DNA polymerase elongation subunit (family B)
MVQALWDLLDRADIVVGYNSDGFDLKHINRELILAGLGPPSPYQTIDLLKTMRHRFKFPSNKLGQVGQSLAIGAKMETGGWKLWQNVLDGDEKARRKFVRYCKQDVRLTADLLAELAPWIKAVPHMGLWTGDMSTCYLCGSTDLAPAGIAYTKTAKYLRVVCECGAYSKVMTNGDTRPA